MPNTTVYDMMAEIYISAHFRKIRHDNDTGFLIIMGDNIELSYFNDSAKDMLREGANKSYGTRAFTGNPLILND